MSIFFRFRNFGGHVVRVDYDAKITGIEEENAWRDLKVDDVAKLLSEKLRNDAIEKRARISNNSIISTGISDSGEFSDRLPSLSYWQKIAARSGDGLCILDYLSYAHTELSAIERVEIINQIYKSGDLNATENTQEKLQGSAQKPLFLSIPPHLIEFFTEYDEAVSDASDEKDTENLVPTKSTDSSNSTSVPRKDGYARDHIPFFVQGAGEERNVWMLVGKSTDTEDTVQEMIAQDNWSKYGIGDPNTPLGFGKPPPTVYPPRGIGLSHMQPTWTMIDGPSITREETELFLFETYTDSTGSYDSNLDAHALSYAVCSDPALLGKSDGELLDMFFSIGQWYSEDRTEEKEKLEEKAMNILYHVSSVDVLAQGYMWSGNAQRCTCGRDTCSRRNYEFNALHHAAFLGCLDLVRYLVDAEVAIEARDTHGNTALTIAADFKHVDVVKFLIKKGANVNVVNWTGENSALLNASFYRNAETVKTDKHIEILKCLVEAGADVNVSNRKGNTPLHMAIREGRRAYDANQFANLEFAMFLVGAGSNVYARNKRGYTPFSFVSLPPNINYALLSACQCTKIPSNMLYFSKMVALLCAAGADVDTVGANGTSCLHYASEDGLFEVVQILLEKKAKIEVVNTHGRTALLSAACYGHCEIVKCLLRAGAYLSIEDVRYAREFGSVLKEQANVESTAKEEFLRQKACDIVEDWKYFGVIPCDIPEWLHPIEPEQLTIESEHRLEPKHHLEPEPAIEPDYPVDPEWLYAAEPEKEPITTDHDVVEKLMASNVCIAFS